jgi:hypothetical protein
MAFEPSLDAAGEHFLPTAFVPFPRGFAFSHDGRLILASGTGPNGAGDNALVAFDPSERKQPIRSSAIQNSVSSILRSLPTATSSNRASTPFGSPDAITTVREYDSANGHLVRVFSANRSAKFPKPRGLRFGADDKLYCVAQDEVVAFDFISGECFGSTAVSSAARPSHRVFSLANPNSSPVK